MRIIIIEDPSEDFARKLLSEETPVWASSQDLANREGRPGDLGDASGQDEVDFDVFLCHSSKDAPEVRAVARDLKSRGVSYWLDEEQIGFGDAVTVKIEDGLRRSRYIVPCVSKDLIAGSWTRAEYGSILNAEFSGNSRRMVIPLMLGGAAISDLPLLLRDKKGVDYPNKAEFERFVQFLRRA